MSGHPGVIRHLPSPKALSRIAHMTYRTMTEKEPRSSAPRGFTSKHGAWIVLVALVVVFFLILYFLV